MRKLLFQLGFCLISFLSNAQIGNVNPYSSYGMGNLNLGNDVIQNSLGNAGFAYVDSCYLNFSNPSSYSRIAAGYPLFSVGVNSTYSVFKQNFNSFARNHVNIDHFVLAFPFAKRFGLGLGLKPFSTRSYSFATTNLLSDGDSLEFQYDGKGTISNAFGGLSFDILNQSSFRWSIGANAGHLFGSSINQRISTFSGSNSGGISFESQRLSALQYDFATTLTMRITTKTKITLTGAYEPAQKWGATFGNELYSSANVTEPSAYQTIDSSFYYGSIEHGGSYGVGVMFDQLIKTTNKQKREMATKIQYVASYRKVAFSQMALNVESNQKLQPYTNDLDHLSFGISVLPDNNFYTNSAVSKLFSRITYRAGFYSDNLPHSFNKAQFNQFGTTFGIGIPVLSQFSFSSLNFGIEYGKRTNSYIEALNERFYGIKIGVILSPSRADSWFRKIKLD